MKETNRILCIIALLAVGSLAAYAQQTDEPARPPKYRLELVYLYDAGDVDENSAKYIFVIGNLGFKSVAALKKFLSIVPPGSRLEWAPGCRRSGDEPLLSSEQDMEDFKAFCAEHNLTFILIPSG